MFSLEFVLCPPLPHSLCFEKTLPPPPPVEWVMRVRSSTIRKTAAAVLLGDTDGISREHTTYIRRRRRGVGHECSREIPAVSYPQTNTAQTALTRSRSATTSFTAFALNDSSSSSISSTQSRSATTSLTVLALNHPPVAPLLLLLPCSFYGGASTLKR